METLSKDVLERQLEKIERLQTQVDELFHTGNFLVRWWNFRKAVRLHQEAGRELDKLNNPQKYYIFE